MPPGVRRLAEEHRGLVLVTGATGSGKSTTLAAMIDHINRTRKQHIITIEDPIEMLHPDRNCIVNQREVGIDTVSFSQALRRALRQDPDVILIGELRDSETAETALQAAESGHLVFSTMHTVDAAETIGRMIEFFPGAKQPMIRSILAGVLRGVVSQRLLPMPDAGRIAAVEVMVVNDRIAELIRENRTEDIPTRDPRRLLLRHADAHAGADRPDDRRARRPRDRDERRAERSRLPDRARPRREGPRRRGRREGAAEARSRPRSRMTRADPDWRDLLGPVSRQAPHDTRPRTGPTSRRAASGRDRRRRRARLRPGLAIGSFLNVVAARIPARISIVAPALELPVLLDARSRGTTTSRSSPTSLLRGRCRTCARRISVKYPLVELATAVLVSACILDFGVTADAAIAAFFCATLVAITVTDLERRVIPNRIVLPAAVVVLVAQTADPSVAGLGDRGARRGALPAARRARLSRRARHGRRQARAPPRRRARRHAPGRADDRDGRGARPVGRARSPGTARRRARWRSRSGRSSPAGALVALFAGHAILDAYLSLV